MIKRNFESSRRKISTIGTETSIEYTSISIKVKDRKRWTIVDAYFEGKYILSVNILSFFSRLKIRVSVGVFNTLGENNNELSIISSVTFVHALKKRK